MAAGLTAPAKGTITKFKVRAGAPGDLKFVVVKRKGDFAKARHITKTFHVQGLGFNEDEASAVETFKAKVKVKKGDSSASSRPARPRCTARTAATAS